MSFIAAGRRDAESDYESSHGPNNDYSGYRRSGQSNGPFYPFDNNGAPYENAPYNPYLNGPLPNRPYSGGPPPFSGGSPLYSAGQPPYFGGQHPFSGGQSGFPNPQFRNAYAPFPQIPYTPLPPILNPAEFEEALSKYLNSMKQEYTR